MTTSSHLETTEAAGVEGLYLNMLARVLTRTGFPVAMGAVRGSGWRAKLYSPIERILDHYGLQVSRMTVPEHRELGRDFPVDAETMVGIKRLQDLRWCIEDILASGIPGDLIETGVWRGGACIFMRGVLKAYGVTDRKVVVADSFEGMPATDTRTYPADEADTFGQWNKIAVSLADVQDNFRRYDLLDDQVAFLQGWFNVSLPDAPLGPLALLRLDCDLYGSTTDVLTALYDRVSIGGHIIVDDYGISTCRAAVNDFRKARGIADEITDIDGAAVRWRRSN
jgi:O-methyltransferase